MKDAVEIVARAICAADGINPDKQISPLVGDLAWHAWQTNATAALRALEAAGYTLLPPEEPVEGELGDVLTGVTPTPTALTNLPGS